MVYDFQVLMPQQGRHVWYQPALVHDGSCHRRPWRPWQSELFENLVRDYGVSSGMRSSTRSGRAHPGEQAEAGVGTDLQFFRRAVAPLYSEEFNVGTIGTYVLSAQAG